MAADDIYHVAFEFQAPTGNASCGLYYQETIAQSGPGIGTTVVAEAVDAALRTEFLDCLSDTWKMPSLICRKMVIDPAPVHREDNLTQVGTVAGQALPANNCLNMALNQSTFSAKSNGRLFIPGVAEASTLVGVVTAAFLAGPFNALRDAIVLTVAELSAGAGRWVPGVISAKVRDAALPFKDWDGAFAPLVSVSSNPIIATQRRRQTRVRGVST